jgi:hypothetical protein
MGYEGVSYKDRAERWGKEAKPRIRQWLLASALGGLTIDQTLRGVSGITNTLGGRLAALGEDEYHGGFMYGTAQAIRQANNGFMYGANRAVDIKQWYPISEVWLTKEDELVCAVCAVKHLTITMEIPRVHTHPNCRCWKMPITLDPHRPMVNFQANPVSWVDFLQSIGKR